MLADGQAIRDLELIAKALEREKVSPRKRPTLSAPDRIRAAQPSSRARGALRGH
jgi:hypothetical protein